MLTAGQGRYPDDTEVDVLPLSSRVLKILAQNKCKTVGEVRAKSDAEWLRCRDVGITALAEIRHVVSGSNMPWSEARKLLVAKKKTGLTQKERSALAEKRRKQADEMLKESMPVRQIADALGVSLLTVRGYVKSNEARARRKRVVELLNQGVSVEAISIDLSGEVPTRSPLTYVLNIVEKMALHEFTELSARYVNVNHIQMTASVIKEVQWAVKCKNAMKWHVESNDVHHDLVTVGDMRDIEDKELLGRKGIGKVKLAKLRIASSEVAIQQLIAHAKISAALSKQHEQERGA